MWNVFVAVRRMQNASRAYADVHSDSDGVVANWMVHTTADWEAWCKVILANTLHIVCPPAALGSGHRAVAHKCSHLAFAWMLSCSGDSADVAQTFVSHTSDMGVELSLPDFTVTSHSELLLAWVDVPGRPRYLEQCEDSTSDEGYVDAPSTAGGAHCRATPQPNQPYFIPNALTVSGLQHTIHNECHKVHIHAGVGEFYY